VRAQESDLPDTEPTVRGRASWPDAFATAALPETSQSIDHVFTVKPGHMV